MGTSSGSRIRAWRARTGQTRAEFAKLVGVHPTTVARWELDVAEPLPGSWARLHQVFGGEVVSRPAQVSEIDHSARRPVLTLPFSSLADREFETFCRDVLALREPASEINLNGSSGQKQLGVDVYWRVDGVLVGVQCKRYARLIPADVRAIASALDDDLNVERVLIALSQTTASAGVRYEISRHPRLELWDGDDFSRVVRELPLDRSVRLLDTYFPGLREPFLGVRNPSNWLTLESWLDEVSRPVRMATDFTHVGRDQDLARLRDSVLGDAEIVFVVGRGGIGKTRLLAELGRARLGREVRFVSNDPLAPDSYSLLPGGDPVVVLDDAHASDHDLVGLVRGIRRERPDATVVLATRPRSLPELWSRLGMTGVDARAATVEVGDLSIDEASALAEEALGHKSEPRRNKLLAQAGYDCPLLIVIGAHLARSGRLTDSELQAGGLLRREIPNWFAETLTGGPDATVRRSVLRAISAVQPVALDREEFQLALAAFTGLELYRVHEVLEELDDLGLILRRSAAVRVVPDLLGDSLLESALVSHAGLSTGFASMIATHASGDALVNAIRNVSIVDWHRRASGPSDLADVLWDALIEHGLGLSASGRMRMGKRLAPVAVIHARRVLDLVEAFRDSPAEVEIDEVSRLWGESGYVTTNDVLESLAPAIANAGRDSSHLARAMRLLVDIGVDDPRPLHQTPGHALRLLEELGSFHPRRPRSHNEAFVGVLRGMLVEEKDTAVRVRLLDLLKPALAHEVVVTETSGMALSITRHQIEHESVREVRADAIEIASAYLDRDVPVAAKAIEVVAAALSGADRADPVTPEFDQVLSVLRALLSDCSVPALLRVSAHRALGWHARYGRGPRREVARAARSMVVKDDDFLVATMVRAGWALYDEEDDDSSRSQLTRSAASQLAQQAISQGASERLVSTIRAAMKLERAVSGSAVVPYGLLQIVFRADPDVALNVVEARHEWDLPDRATVLRCALDCALASDPDRSDLVARELLRQSAQDAAVVADVVFGYNNAERENRRTLALECARSAYPEVHAALFGAYSNLERHDLDLLQIMVEAAPVEAGSLVSDAMLNLFAYDQKLGWATLPERMAARVLERLAEADRLPAHSLGEVLNMHLRERPWEVLQFLRKRVEREKKSTASDVMPHLESMALDFTQVNDLQLMLDWMVAWVTSADDWQTDLYGRQIIVRMLGGFGPASLATVTDLVDRGDEASVELARSLLNDAPKLFVLSNVGFVVEMIGSSVARLPKTREAVISGLHGSATYGTVSRTVGTDDPDEVALRDQALEISARYSDDPAVAEFYATVSRYAQSRLAEQRRGDRQLSELRDWD